MGLQIKHYNVKLGSYVTLATYVLSENYFTLIFNPLPDMPLLDTFILSQINGKWRYDVKNILWTNGETVIWLS